MIKIGIFYNYLKDYPQLNIAFNDCDLFNCPLSDNFHDGSGIISNEDARKLRDFLLKNLGEDK